MKWIASAAAKRSDWKKNANEIQKEYREKQFEAGVLSRVDISQYASTTTELSRNRLIFALQQAN